MGKIVATEFLSLDGVMEAPHEWSGQFGSEGFNKFKLEETMESEALLLGRVTFEGFAAAWPDRTDEAGFADKFNSMPKHVVSSTLESPEWNNSSVIPGGDLESGVAALKRQPGGDVVIHGSAQLVNGLTRLRLIDEYRLMIFPIVVGTGKRLFEDGIDQTVLELVDTKSIGAGVVVLTYGPAGDDGPA